jgi:hypothetical protein
MLDHLFAIITAYETGHASKDATYDRVRSWMEQHCCSADDFAFSLACRARDYYAWPHLHRIKSGRFGALSFCPAAIAPPSKLDLSRTLAVWFGSDPPATAPRPFSTKEGFGLR